MMTQKNALNPFFGKNIKNLKISITNFFKIFCAPYLKFFYGLKFFFFSKTFFHFSKMDKKNVQKWKFQKSL
jgi:hypothetical protein